MYPDFIFHLIFWTFGWGTGSLVAYYKYRKPTTVHLTINLTIPTDDMMRQETLHTLDQVCAAIRGEVYDNVS